MSESRRKRRAARSAHSQASRSSPSPISSVSDGRPTLTSALGGRGLWISLGLALSVAVVYFPVHSYGFVRYDDPQYVSENPHVAGGLSWSGFAWALTAGYAGNWHP